MVEKVIQQKMSLLEQYLTHDTEIIGIFVDRSNSSTNDSIQIFLRDYVGKSFKIIFYDVYWFRCIINGGVIAKETIRTITFEDKQNENIQALAHKWKGLLIVNDLIYIKIETNSTASVLELVIFDFVIENR